MPGSLHGLEGAQRRRITGGSTGGDVPFHRQTGVLDCGVLCESQARRGLDASQGHECLSIAVRPDGRGGEADRLLNLRVWLGRGWRGGHGGSRSGGGTPRRFCLKGSLQRCGALRRAFLATTHRHQSDQGSKHSDGKMWFHDSSVSPTARRAPAATRARPRQDRITGHSRAALCASRAH